MDHIQTCVVGAGVVGLAIARQLSQAGQEVFLLEAEKHYGQGTSSRNSEVIHAGLYYPAASLKSELCQRGNKLLYQYCAEQGVAHKKCGKLVVASSDSELTQLQHLFNLAGTNAVDDLTLLDAEQVKALEPSVNASGGFISPSTGIVSAHELMDAYCRDFSDAGGELVLSAEVSAVEYIKQRFVVTVGAGLEAYQFSCDKLINSAGLGARELAAKCDFISAPSLPPVYFCKGSYFSYSTASPFKMLIYPIPEQSGAGLGVHATIDLDGRLRFGPDVEYLTRSLADINYIVDETKRDDFTAAIRNYFPDVDVMKLAPAYAGIRPKLQGPGEAVKDFSIESFADRGVPGYVQLMGIESPGLTSSLAIADYVFEMMA